MPKSQQPERGTQLILGLIKPEACVLDIGAGDGRWGKLLKDKVKKIDAVEVWPKHAQQLWNADLYDHVYCKNILDFEFENGTYTTAILGDVLEHFRYGDAIRLLQTLKANVNEIFLIVPINVCIQDGSYYGNPYETHHYHWHDYALRFKHGFQLLNIGVNENGLVAIGAYVWRR